MSGCCSICASKTRQQIDILIASDASNRAISRQYPEFSKDAVRRHRPHLSEKIKAAQEAKDIQEGLDLQACAQEIYDLAVGSARSASAANQFHSIGSCLAPAVKVLEILKKGKEGDDQEPNQGLKKSGFFDSYMSRAKEVYAPKDQNQSPAN